MIKIYFKELIDSLKNSHIWILLSYYDILQRYKRSTLGQFWITITTGVLIIGMATIYSVLFKIEIEFYIVYIAMNFILWQYLNSTIQESCQAFISASSYLRNEKWNLFIFTNRVISRNFITFLHNYIIVILVFIYNTPNFKIDCIIFSIFSFIIINLTLVPATMIIAILSTRYRDLHLIIQNIMQLTFFLTPVMWTTELMQGKRSLLIDLNPFAIALKSVNSPILYNSYYLKDLAELIFICIATYLISIFIFFYKSKKITYWL